MKTKPIKAKSCAKTLGIALLLLSPLSASSVFAQDSAVNVQTAPPPAPAPETPFARALIRLDDLEAQIRTLTDRLERAEAELASQKAENARLAKIIDDNRAANIQLAEKKPDNTTVANSQTNIASSSVTEVSANEASAPQTNIAQKAEAEAGDVSASSPNTVTTAVVPEAAKTSVAPSSAPTTSIGAAAKPAAAPLKSAQALLSEARLMLQRSEFANAEAHLVLLTENYADAPETPEGLWLLGETRFVQKAYNPAALAYVAYLSKAPTGPRVSDSLLRLSSAFREIGDNRQRCLAFKEYQKRTPNPTPVQAARASAELAKGPCN